MRIFVIPLAALLAVSAVPARAQVGVRIELGLPVAPRLVVVQPGIQVVEGFHEEVFFHRGWYWCRRPDGWYRSRSPQARFEWIERRRVPGGLVGMPEGRYRNWRHEEAARSVTRSAARNATTNAATKMRQAEERGRHEEEHERR